MVLMNYSCHWCSFTWVLTVLSQLHLCDTHFHSYKWSFVREWRVLALTCQAPIAWAADICASVRNSTCTSRGSSCGGHLLSLAKLRSRKWSYTCECLPISFMNQFQTGPGPVMGPCLGAGDPCFKLLFIFFFYISWA